MLRTVSIHDTSIKIYMIDKYMLDECYSNVVLIYNIEQIFTQLISISLEIKSVTHE